MATPISSLGEFGLIEKLSEGIELKNKSSVTGIGDDAAVIECGGKYLLMTTDMMMEGIDFDLVYHPLPHLGYKAVVKGVSDIYAMNGTPKQITVSVAMSAKFTAEQVEELYSGIKAACGDYGTDLVGGDTSSSLTGLAISVTVLGEAEREKITYRSGAKVNDIICISGDLGAACMGAHLLEREKRALDGVKNPKPRFDGHEYILKRQLKPYARKDIKEALDANGLVPSSMIDISDGLGAEVIHICKQSGVGARVYLDRIPISKECFEMAEEMNFDPVVAALNGGDDYELLFTVPLEKEKIVKNIAGVEIIGYITDASKGAVLATPDGGEVEIKAPGWGDNL